MDAYVLLATTPRVEDDVSGKLNVWVVPEDAMFISLPAVEVANVCVAPVNPLRDTTAALSLLLKVVQSAAANKPLFEPEELGRLNVCTVVAELMLKSVPVVLDANVCEAPVRVFRVVMPVSPAVQSALAATIFLLASSRRQREAVP